METQDVRKSRANGGKNKAASSTLGNAEWQASTKKTLVPFRGEADDRCFWSTSLETKLSGINYRTIRNS
jgi:hypothetical protein